jgi:ribosomal protein S27AE
MSNLPEKEAEWDKIATKIFREVAEWNRAHPEAKFVEIEEAIDQKLARLRSQILKDSSEGKAVNSEQNRLKCGECGVKLHKRGKQKRRVLTEQGENLELEREYLVCPNCGVGLFPPRCEIRLGGQWVKSKPRTQIGAIK